MNSRITVIVIGYNHADFIVECLESIRGQSRQADAVLVFDDASPDTTDRVVRTYLAAHPGFAEYQRNVENQGLNRTLNQALALVATELVTYISADDFMLPDRLAKQAALMDSTGAYLSYSDAVVVDSDSMVVHETSRIEFPWPDEPRRSQAVLECLFEGNWIPAASIMMRTEALRDIGGYHDRIFFEDFELLTRAAARGWTFVHVDEPLVAVRRLETSLGARSFDGNSSRFLVALDVALRNYPRDGGELAGRVTTARWEIAKRASRTDLPIRESLALLWRARAGASSPLAVLKHVAAAIVRGFRA